MQELDATDPMSDFRFQCFLSDAMQPILSVFRRKRAHVQYNHFASEIEVNFQSVTLLSERIQARMSAIGFRVSFEISAYCTDLLPQVTVSAGRCSNCLLPWDRFVSGGV